MRNINIETSADSELLQESKGREGVGRDEMSQNVARQTTGGVLKNQRSVLVGIQACFRFQRSFNSICDAVRHCRIALWCVMAFTDPLCRIHKQ